MLPSLQRARVDFDRANNHAAELGMTGLQDTVRHLDAAGTDVFGGHSAQIVEGIELWQGKPMLPMTRASSSTTVQSIWAAQ